METTKQRLVRAILAMDRHLPHDEPIDLEDIPKPAWCAPFKAVLGRPGQRCCGVCAELSPVTLEALDTAFADVKP